MRLRWRQLHHPYTGEPHFLARRGRLEFMIRPIGSAGWMVYARRAGSRDTWRDQRSTDALYGARRLAENYL